MKIYISDSWIHKCNLDGLLKMIDFLHWEKVPSLFDADIVYSASEPMYGEELMLNKKFIYGPHFCVFPYEEPIKKLKNYGNSVYIQPCKWVQSYWVDEFKYKELPIKIFPFPIDVNKYTPGKKEERTKVCIYFKNRKIDELKFIEEKLKEKNIEYIIIQYGTYKEDDYRELLKSTKYIILLTAHESQSFSNLCARACDVPLLVWDVDLMAQEEGCPIYYNNVKTKVTSVPYFDEKCGEIFTKKEEFDNTFQKFLTKLDEYKPRDYVLENLTVEKCAQNLKKLVEEI